MSHTMEVKVELKDVNMLKKAAQNVGATVKEGTHTLYDGKSYTGIGIFLKGWKYPVVITNDGTAKFDNFNNCWGHMDRFNELKQQYAVECVQEKLRKNKIRGSVSTNSEGEIVIKCKVAV